MANLYNNELYDILLKYEFKEDAQHEKMIAVLSEAKEYLEPLLREHFLYDFKVIQNSQNDDLSDNMILYKQSVSMNEIIALVFSDEPITAAHREFVNCVNTYNNPSLLKRRIDFNQLALYNAIIKLIICKIDGTYDHGWKNHFN